MTIKIRITDLNYGGHLGNDKLLSLLHEARVGFIKSLGFEGEMNIEGVGIIMTDVAVVYKSEAFYNDNLKIEVGVDDINRYGLDFYYRVSDSQTGKEVAQAKTGIVFYHYELKKIVSLPDGFLRKIRN